MILSLEERSKAYYRSSIMDGLTGTYNKAYILDIAGKSFSLCRRYAQSLAVVFLDVDHFKRVNDTHGHLVGDAVLKRIAAILMEQTRREDTTGRYGGEEFLILLPNTDLAGGRTVADKVRLAIEAERELVEGLDLRMTVSAGVAELRAHGAASAEELIEQADSALLQAKREGRNRTVVCGMD